MLANLAPCVAPEKRHSLATPCILVMCLIICKFEVFIFYFLLTLEARHVLGIVYHYFSHFLIVYAVELQIVQFFLRHIPQLKMESTHFGCIHTKSDASEKAGRVVRRGALT